LVSFAQEIINKIGSSNRKKILVTLQWGLDQCPNHHKTGMPVGLISCIKETSVSFDWWIRVHPVMLQGNRRAATFSMLKKEFSSYENVYWEYCTDMPLPIVLAQTDLHITVSSATTIEAGWFGIRTALLSADYKYLLNWFSEELSSEIAEFVLPQCDAIRRWVERCLLLSKEPVNTFMSTQPLDNFIKEIQVTCLRSP
jgi:hypothetical protein